MECNVRHILRMFFTLMKRNDTELLTLLYFSVIAFQLSESRLSFSDLPQLVLFYSLTR